MFSSEQIWKAVDALALEHGLSASRLSILAGLDPTALNKSKRISADGRQRWMSLETVAKILTVTGTPLDRFVHMVDCVKGDAAAHDAGRQPLGQSWVGTKAAILLVDPDRSFGARVAAVFGDAGYNLCAMPDFRRGLEFLESGLPIDLMMVHVALPHGVHGSALARIARIRRPQLKILFLADDDGEPAAGGEPLTPLLRKPLDETHLLAEAARLLLP